jgi:alkanesulfonate monooxygenase SsuD/methylene tetrahydromethanopterin reductase-like flavin-dependent oxidoreductase (luciferase family)
MGFEKEAGVIQDLYLDRKYEEAAAAVPLDFIDRTSLIGPVDRIAERMQALAASGVTTVNVSSYGGSLDERLATLRSLADALDKSGVGD